jgi:hypothetical protein
VKCAVSGSVGMLRAPAGEVGNNRLEVDQVQLGLVEDPPAARAAAAPLKGSVELAAKHSASVCVSRCRPRRDIERAVDDLGSLVVRDSAIRVVERLAAVLLRGHRHRR